jgi:hypothetical protein
MTFIISSGLLAQNTNNAKKIIGVGGSYGCRDALNVEGNYVRIFKTARVNTHSLKAYKFGSVDTPIVGYFNQDDSINIVAECGWGNGKLYETDHGAWIGGRYLKWTSAP